MDEDILTKPGITLQKLRILIAVANEGKFSKAGDKLGITQPAVSLQVKELEIFLGASIFERISTGVKPTELGQQLIIYARQILSLTLDLENSARQYSNLELGSLNVGASSTPGDYILPMIIKDFHSSYPGINITLSITNTETVINQLIERKIDIGVGGKENTLPEIQSFELDKDDIIIVSPPKLAEAFAGKNLQDIANLALVFREKGSATRTVAEDYLKQKGIALKNILELGSNEAVKSAVKYGAGSAMLSRHAVKEDLDAGHLCKIEHDDWDCSRNLYVYQIAKSITTPAHSKFINSLEGWNKNR